MTRRMIYLCIIVVAFFVWMVGVGAFSHVIREEGKVYIVDGTGERWDFTQAESIGFQPEKFQYGLGRNAFTPLDDSYLRDDTDHVPEHLRVLGVVEGSEAKAYSIPRLRSHEIANSRIGSRAIAVGYWPLVNLAAVYSREIDGQTLTLAPTGWTYDSTFVLYDKETGSLWYPDERSLMGIQGKYFKRRLHEIPSEDIRWKKWESKHPHSKILR